MMHAKLAEFYLFASISVCFGLQAACAGEPTQDAAAKLASSIKKAKLQKIAVVPLVFLKDARRKQQAGDWGSDRSKPPAVDSTPSASLESLLLAEQMERYLSIASDGAFRLVPSIDLQHRISQYEGEISALHPRGKEFASVINPDGDLDGMIVGEVSRFFGIQQSSIEEITELGAEKKSIQWSMIDLSDRTIRDTDFRGNSEVSIAEVVYRGYSAEFFRYEGSKLRCFLNYRNSDRSTVPLSPRESELLFRRKSGSDKQVHPVTNPRNPFKVAFEANGKSLPMTFVLDESGPEVRILEALIHLEPNDEFAIQVSNRSPQSVMVAVFVDGVNILGKQRELPDENCHVWSLASNAKARFSSWYTIDGVPSTTRENANVEPFVISDWSDSVAGKMGLDKDADTSGSITIVFFSNGLPSRNNLLFYENPFLQSVELSPDRRGFSVQEREIELSMGASRRFGVGAQPARRQQVQMIPNARAGTILTSMTFRYCPKSDTKQVVDARLASEEFGHIPKYTILEIPAQP